MHIPLISLVLVCAQFLLVSFMAWRAYLLDPQPLILAVYLATTIPGFAGIYEMRKSKFRVTPEPAASATLLTTGIYRYIRHPMYTALLLFAAAVMLVERSMVSLVLFVCLCQVLTVKARYEESLLGKRFPDYSSYMKQTKRFIPFLV